MNMKIKIPVAFAPVSGENSWEQPIIGSTATRQRRATQLRESASLMLPAQNKVSSRVARVSSIMNREGR